MNQNNTPITELSTTIQIGKKGITDSLVAEIKKQIEIRELVKIKILKNAFGEKDKDQIIEELLSKTGTALIHKVGFVIVVGKKE